MTEKERVLVKKLSDLEEITATLRSQEFDSFKVCLISKDEVIYEFLLVEESKEVAKKGLINQLKVRSKKLIKELTKV